MQQRLKLSVLIALGIALGVAMPATAQSSRSRSAILDGKPNLNGIWEAVGTADWDLEDHSAKAGPFWQFGAIGAIPARQRRSGRQRDPIPARGSDQEDG